MAAASTVSAALTRHAAPRAAGIPGPAVWADAIAWDPEIRQDAIEAVPKDNLTVQISGQIRWKPAERNLYAYLFGISHPAAHVVGYFISVLRDRIATFHGEAAEGAVEGVSINDLRRNLSLINSFMEDACRKTAARYGIDLHAALITNIRAPYEPSVAEELATTEVTVYRPGIFNGTGDQSLGDAIMQVQGDECGRSPCSRFDNSL